MKIQTFSIVKTAFQFSDQAPLGRYNRRYQNKIGASHPIKPRPDILKRQSQVEQLSHWQSELDYWQVEVNFYHHLLTMGVFNCKQDSRHRLDYLSNAFSVFQKEILPEMKAFLEDILSDTLNRDKLQLATLQQELMEHAKTLKKLKLEVFPHLPELLIVSIW